MLTSFQKFELYALWGILWSCCHLYKYSR